MAPPTYSNPSIRKQGGVNVQSGPLPKIVFPLIRAAIQRWTGELASPQGLPIARWVGTQGVENVVAAIDAVGSRGDALTVRNIEQQIFEDSKRAYRVWRRAA